jgi:hypothetical protein
MDLIRGCGLGLFGSQWWDFVNTANESSGTTVCEARGSLSPHSLTARSRSDSLSNLTDLLGSVCGAVLQYRPHESERIAFHTKAAQNHDAHIWARYSHPVVRDTPRHGIQSHIPGSATALLRVLVRAELRFPKVAVPSNMTPRSLVRMY